MRKSWKELIAEIVEQLPREFELRDVLRFEPELARHYPDNKHIGAKIRQTLQILRDQGSITFEGPGRYRKALARSRFSPLIDFAAATAFDSRAQVARIVLETWAEYNLFCLSCDSDSLVRLSANTPVADFECAKCSEQYQVKGKDGRFGPTITGAAYAPLLNAIRGGACPSYILIEYDRRYSTVVFGSAIRGSLITADRVLRRTPLAVTAKRAGWVGSNLHIAGLPQVALVEPQVVDPSAARAEWQRSAKPG